MIGPANPLATGQRDVLSPNVIRQWYPDGCTYQISMRRGAPFALINSHARHIPADHLKKSEWLTVLEPHVWNDDDDHVYLSLWVANE